MKKLKPQTSHLQTIRDVAVLRECAGTEYSRNLATGILPVAKFRGNFAVSTRVLDNP
ncbi:hypothetical protein [Brunnivagina elsteri]|uniref:hypothetical protein n=1 Tax=Brunnivagina elsteri TaxID=1247191 RepID=UPI0013046547|nr:hypothetical protein [Calothrix elsteri]